jgi:hypothetical protein
MGFLDKVKETAAKAGEGVKKGTASVKDKMEDSQLRKKADENARQIGYVVVRERTTGESDGGEIDRLVQEIVAIEAKIAEGPEQAVQAESAPATPGEKTTTAEQKASVPPTSASEPTTGDFKLD